MHRCASLRSESSPFAHELVSGDWKPGTIPIFSTRSVFPRPVPRYQKSSLSPSCRLWLISGKSLLLCISMCATLCDTCVWRCTARGKSVRPRFGFPGKSYTRHSPGLAALKSFPCTATEQSLSLSLALCRAATKSSPGGLYLPRRAACVPFFAAQV